jgi:DeoR/GlpR family transcriptional regulator of sugar metabolism
MLPQAATTGTDFRARSHRMREAEPAIAAQALAFVPRHGAIALDAGTTTLELAAVLPPTAEITVVTPSLSVINTLLPHEGVEVVTLGGKLYPVRSRSQGRRRSPRSRSRGCARSSWPRPA